MTPNQHWQASLYDNHHQFVSELGRDMIQLLNPQKDQKILDLGCGTGDLANRINKLCKEVIGIDASSEMIAAAKKKYPHMDFRVMDANHLSFEESFDAVFSNAVFHWISTPERALRSVYRSLKPNGKLVMEFGGKDNCRLMIGTVINTIRTYGYNYEEKDFPWYFPSIGEFSSLLEKIGFDVNYAVHFVRPTKLEGPDGFLNWTKMFTGNLFQNVSDQDIEPICQKANALLKTQLYKNGHWYGDYKRIRVVATRV